MPALDAHRARSLNVFDGSEAAWHRCCPSLPAAMNGARDSHLSHSRAQWLQIEPPVAPPTLRPIIRTTEACASAAPRAARRQCRAERAGLPWPACGRRHARPAHR
jgi:hypothetical protein